MSAAARRWTGGDLVVASTNPGKVREIGELLAPYDAHARPVSAFTDEVPEEDGETFAANALIKARAAARASDLPALADDSGLAVAALDGAPGIRSARWAGPDRDFGVAMARIEELVADAADRSAEFVCALALAWPDGTERCVEGRVGGTLSFPPRGTNGFGYDPIFVPEGHRETFGEMDPARKAAISHRAEAFRRLVRECFAA